ncbi:hypothetical protein [Streptomyces sp. NPDC048057]|uniref:hypothetical protein n=1 Tax=Streptomyces sp. NPDC048057 TaxID=3155628 RepID=UPI003403A2BC
MGVFSWFSRKPKGSSSEAPRGASAEAEAPAAAADETGAKPSATSEPTEVETAPAGAAKDAGAPGPSGCPDAAGVDIPRQQSAGDAADSEAGESARQ